MPLPADDLLLGPLADGARVDDDEVGRLERSAPPRSPPRAGARPSPPSRCGSSGSRASTRGTAAARPAPGRYSVSRSSIGATGDAAARRRGAAGARTSSTGSERVAVRVSCTAGPWYADLRPRPLSSMPWTSSRSSSNPETWVALLTLTVLEIVLGIDNVIFISILVQRLPARPARPGPTDRPGPGDGDADPPAADDLVDHRAHPAARSRSPAASSRGAT